MTQSRVKFYLKDYQAPAYWQDKINLDFQLQTSHTEVRAKSHFIKNKDIQNSKNEITLNGVNLKLISLRINGVDHSDYTLEDSQLILKNIPEEFELEIVNHIDPSSNKSMEGLYLSNGLYCTQCEAQGFRKITYYLDRPDNMAIFTVRIEADKKQFPFLLSNGNPVESGEAPEGRHFALWHDPFRKPAHLFALVAGDLDHIEDTYKTMSGRDVTLRVYANRGRRERCHHAMNSLKWSFKWDEDRYGLEYDLDLFMIVAVDDFNMGAMENKGLNIYNSSAALADVKSADDASHFRITSIVGHEYFHNWSGNRVNCRDWFQLSLKEGLTVYRDQEFTADLFSRPVQRLSDVSALREAQFNEDAGPNAHPVRPDSAYSIDNFYTSTIYEKGAELIRMLETILGTTKFEEGIKKYFSLYDGQAVTTDDFVHAMEIVSGEDFTHFKKWYTQSGTPHVKAEGVYDAAKQEYSLKLTQKTAPTALQQNKEALFIPVKMGLLGSNGQDLINPNTLLRLTKDEETFVFKNISENPIPSLFRDFSAPVKYSFDYSTDDYLFLMKHDSNRFNRWEANQQVLTHAILSMYESFKKGEAPFVDSKIFTGLYDNLTQEGESDPYFTSYMLQVPSYTQLVTGLNDIEPHMLAKAIGHMETLIGQHLEKGLLDAFEKFSSNDKFEITPRAIGERRLVRSVLRLLCASGNVEFNQLALKHYQLDNMEAKTSAIHALLAGKSPELETALGLFYKNFASDPLLFNNWIRLQVAHLTTDITAALDKIYADSHFQSSNPNNNTSIWYGFREHPARLHQKDGSVYKKLADKIIEIDAFNENLAARLANIFSNWKRYSAPYSSLMQNELKRISEAKLSPNTYEIITNALKS